MRLYLALSYPEAVGGVISGGWIQRYIPPCSGIERERDVQLRILLSYWYYKDVDLDKLFAKYFTPPYPDVFADSGAFSAMTQGVEININKYIEWIKRYNFLIGTYSNLDVIKNEKKTLENQKYMENKGLNPLPCFHVMEDWKYLENYIRDYQYIGLGVAGNQAKREKVMSWLIKCFQIAGQDAVFHGFGLTSWEVMSQLRWYSVDSSSWGSGFRFGTVPLFDNQRGRFEKAKLGNAAECLRLSRLFEDLGFNWQDFADRKRNDRAKICAISALSYMKAEQYLRRKFGEVYIPGSNAPEGLRAHLADANPVRLHEAASGLRLHLADTGGIKENYAKAENGVKAYLAAGQNSENSNSGIPAIAESGIKVHLADARAHTAADKSAAQTGLKVHLAEHSLDRGGVGDTSRAMEVLNEKNSL